jgi:hypothetical protein
MSIKPMSNEFTVNSSDATDGVAPSVSGQEGGFFLVAWEGVTDPLSLQTNDNEIFGRAFKS